MDHKNFSFLTEVILLGFSTDRRINISLFVILFLIYLITVIGNVLIIFIIVSNQKLHTPMYYFPCILSLIDSSYSTSCVPRLLSDLLSVRRAISLRLCLIQVYIAIFIVGSETFLLTIMAYDRYVAICRPLHYSVVMRWSVCYRITAFLFISSSVMLLPQYFSTAPLCHPNQIQHFMCEVLSVMGLMCYHMYSDENVVLVICFLIFLLPFLFILGTYLWILSSTLKIHSVRGSKAISTCTSHITVVVLFYGTAMIQYFGTNSPYSTNHGKYFSIFHVIVCPMLNPIIYTLNNTEVKKTLKKMFHVVFVCVVNN